MEYVNWRVLLVGVIIVGLVLYFQAYGFTQIISLNEWFLSATGRTPVEDTGW